MSILLICRLDFFCPWINTFVLQGGWQKRSSHLPSYLNANAAWNRLLYLAHQIQQPISKLKILNLSSIFIKNNNIINSKFYITFWFIWINNTTKIFCTYFKLIEQPDMVTLSCLEKKNQNFNPRKKVQLCTESWVFKPQTSILSNKVPIFWEGQKNFAKSSP